MSRNLEHRHYSEKGGHEKRGFWAGVRREFGKKFRGTPFAKPNSPEQEYLIRRSMLRNPRNGKG